MKYKFLEHTADIKFQAFGKNLDKVFKNCALALFESLYKGKIKPKIKKKFSVEGEDLENLLYNFLEEFLFLLDSEEFLGTKISKLKINKEKNSLSCEVAGDSAKNYKGVDHIKAVTYNDMSVKAARGGWVAQVVLDV